MEMINKTTRDALERAGMNRPQAEAIAVCVPDWSQFATKADLKQLERALTRRLIILVGMLYALCGVLFLVIGIS